MYKKLSKSTKLASIAGLVLGMVIFLVPGAVLAADFVGSDQCQGCHEQNYRDWSASGHPYKLMKSEQARYRPIPLPLGTTWDDVSYVIGGYKWKSRYMDKDGYIITVTEDENGNAIDGGNQYNYLTGEWVDYHAGEEKVPYDCGSCHTTNWVANPDPTDLSGNQDGLPGIHGTFSIGGVHCEQCHGNGLGFPGSGAMEVDDSVEACGICHYRTAAPGAPENVIPASSGFIKHHEQYNEHLASPHADALSCVDCHNPHKRGEFSIWQEGDSDEYPAAQCGVDCHGGIGETYATTPMAGYGVECKDCHLPYATKSANQLGPFEGDVQTHLFYINTDENANMFTEDGAFVALDENGKGAATLDFACIRCHETAEMSELARFAKNFHGTDDSVSELEYVGLNPGLTGNWWGGMDRNGEGFLLEIAEAGGVLTLVGSFYTYDTDGNQLWLIATGAANTGMTSDVTVYISSGRTWGQDTNTAANEVFGTGTFTFPACDVGSFTMTPNAKYMGLGFTSIGYDLSRDITVSKIACPTFDNTTAP